MGLVGGLAQWSELRSFRKLRFECDHFVGRVSSMGQITRRTQHSIFSVSVNK